jgi:hypothetical protein
MPEINETVPAEFAGAHEDKHWVSDQIEMLLKHSTDEKAAYLLPRFKWLLSVWNTDKDFAYPSLDEVEDEGPMTLEHVLGDYCRDEGTDEECQESLAQWTDDLDAAGAEYSVDEGVSGVEVGWEMTLGQAFWLRLNRGWFREDGFYGPSVEQELTRLYKLHERSSDDPSPSDARMADEVRTLWEAYKADPANKAAR